MRKAIIAAAAVSILAFTSSVASAQVCVVGIFAAGFYASLHDHRELTAKEAWSCGLLYGSDTPAPKKKIVRHHRRAKRH